MKKGINVILSLALCMTLVFSVVPFVSADVLIDDSLAYVSLQDFNTATAGAKAVGGTIGEGGDGISGNDWGLFPSSATYRERAEGDNWLEINENSDFHYWVWSSSVKAVATTDYLSYYIDSSSDSPFRIITRVKNSAWEECNLNSEYSYKLMSPGGYTIDKSSTYGIEIPARFKGFVLIPVSSFDTTGKIDDGEILSGIVRVGLSFQQLSVSGTALAIDDYGIVKDLSAFKNVCVSTSRIPEEADQSYSVIQDFTDGLIGSAVDILNWGDYVTNPQYVLGDAEKQSNPCLQFSGSGSTWNRHAWIKTDVSEINFTQTGHIAFYIKGGAHTGTKIRFITKTNSGETFFYSDIPYKLMAMNGVVTTGSGTGIVELPYGFEGFVLVENSFFSTAVLSNLTMFDIGFDPIDTNATYQIDDLIVIHDFDIFKSGFKAETGIPEVVSDTSYTMLQDFNSATVGITAPITNWGNLMGDPMYVSGNGNGNIALQLSGDTSPAYNCHAWVNIFNTNAAFTFGDYIAFYINTGVQEGTKLKFWTKSSAGELVIAEPIPYSLMGMDGTVTEGTGEGLVELPSGFEGYVFVENTAFTGNVLSGLTVIDFNFDLFDVTATYVIDNILSVHDVEIFAQGFAQHYSSITDSSLSNLSVDTGAISPVFDPETESYTVTVASNVAELTITAAANNGDASVTGTGTFGIPVGATSFTVTVTAKNQIDTTEYIVTVIRAMPQEAGSAQGLVNIKKSVLFGSGYSSELDINGDGENNVVDAVLIQKYIVSIG